MIFWRLVSSRLLSSAIRTAERIGSMSRSRSTLIYIDPPVGPLPISPFSVSNLTVAFADRGHRGLGPRSDGELQVDRVEVGVDRRDPDAQGASDLLVGQAATHQDKDLPLAR